MSNDIGESKYGVKRRSGKMMYGPARTVPKVPEFKTGRVHVRCDHGRAYNACATCS